MTAFPWDTAMQFGFGVLKLHPAQFWAMTPRELAAAIAAQPVRQGSAPGRAELEKLMCDHPDRMEKKHG